ncbi:MAG TPA: diguanylate cyclase [Clostridium sp.]|nr:diguanylate cyclase [Clostridium sp.]
MESKVKKIDVDLEYLMQPLSESEKNNEFIAMESKSMFKDAWDTFKKNKLALVSLGVIGIMIVMAVLGPMLSSYTYDAQDLSMTNSYPSAQHFFGTDKFGRDIFVRVWYGARISLSVGFVSALISLVIGVTYGAVSGYIGGKTDMIMMGIVDIIYAIPSMLYVILIMLVLGSNIYSILLGMSISSWIGMARLVRGEVLKLKEQEFSLAAVVLGASNKRILFKHLVINALGPIIVQVTFLVPQAIFQEAFLSFVGVGISAPLASWGSLAQDARTQIEIYPIQIVWPIVAICLTILALNFVGEGLGRALDPKKNR